MIRFYKKRYVYFGISIAIMLVGLITALVNGVALDIQFKGGTILKYSYSGTLDPDAAANVVEKAIGKSVTGQLQSNLAQNEKLLVLSLAEKETITTQGQEKIISTLNEKYPDAKISLYETQTVEPFIGARFFKRGMFAIGLSFLLILIYVGFRFQNIGGLSAGTMAIIALIHDTLVVTIAFIVFRIPLNDSYIAAMLTIIGFSINDTIVIYDRIRENKRLLGSKISVEDLVDKSINQSMSRSINTNLAVFLSITIVYIFSQIFHIESIRDFALPMMFGTISGCYSTICIAGPLWTMWQNHKNKNKPNAKPSKA